MAIRWSIKTDEQDEDRGVLTFVDDQAGSWEMLIGSMDAGSLAIGLEAWAEGEDNSYEGTIG